MFQVLSFLLIEAVRHVPFIDLKLNACWVLTDAVLTFLLAFSCISCFIFSLMSSGLSFLTVVNLTLVDLPGLTKVAVGMFLHFII